MQKRKNLPFYDGGVDNSYDKKLMEDVFQTLKFGSWVWFKGHGWRISEVDLGKKNFCIRDIIGTTIWVSREDLLEQMIDFEIKQTKEAILA